MSVMGFKQFKKLFREAASLDIDKSDVKRLSNFVASKLRDLLILGQVNAKINGRYIIDYQDIPITGGLQQAIHEFKDMNETLSLSQILEQLATLPPLKMELSTLLEEKLPELVGGITINLAKIFKIINPGIKNPGTEDWNKVEAICQTLL